MKKFITKAGQLSFFVFISVPLACFLYATVNVYFEAKRLIKSL